MNLQTFIIGAFFCYGMYTLQRPAFLMDFLPRLWKLFPKYLHEPLFSCGVCVSSVWGIVYLTLDYFRIYPVCYLIAFCGLCAILDRSIKFFEYGYNYKGIRGNIKTIYSEVCVQCGGKGHVMDTPTSGRTCDTCKGMGLQLKVEA